MQREIKAPGSTTRLIWAGVLAVVASLSAAQLSGCALGGGTIGTGFETGHGVVGGGTTGTGLPWGSGGAAIPGVRQFNLDGRLLAESGAPLAGVEVTVESPYSTDTSITDEDGRFDVSAASGNRSGLTFRFKGPGIEGHYTERVVPSNLQGATFEFTRQGRGVKLLRREFAVDK